MSSEVMDETMNNVQRALGELKGSVQCMKVWLDADGQGWREHLDRLEKELENLKDKSDDEIIAAKHSLRNEMKVKLGDLMAEMERIRRQERDEVQLGFSFCMLYFVGSLILLDVLLLDQQDSADVESALTFM